MAGYKEWIENAEIKIDYFSAFLKAWIAFNAWYNNSGEIQGKTDQQCIEYISEQTNRFKQYIISLLEQDGSESKSYKSNIAKLHEALLNSPITSQKYLGLKQDISFSQIAIKNKNANHHFDYNGVNYSCIKSHGKMTTVVRDIKKNSEIFVYEQEGWNDEELRQQTDFISMTKLRKDKCIECYNAMRPYIMSSVLCVDEFKTEEEKKIHSIELGVYSFVKDTNKISEAIVKILYMLRCCLAHGDITPDDKTKDVYKYAYEVLLTPLLKLK